MAHFKLDLQRFRGHLKELDGFRGLAIGLVLLFHLFPFIPISKFGWSGVDLFFVLSGFLITGILLDTVGEEYFWRNFIIRRVLRIFPLYYFVLILFCLLSLLSSDFASLRVVNFQYFKENQVWYWLYVSNIKTFLNGKWLPTIVFNPLWSLSIEEQFYIFWPLIILKVQKNRQLFILTVIFIASIIICRMILLHQGFLGLSVYVFTLTRLDTILLGSLIAIMVRQDHLRLFLEKYCLLFMVGSSLVLLFLIIKHRTFSPYHYDIQFYGYTILAFLFGSLLLILIDKQDKFLTLKKIFRSRLLVFLGTYSYSIYIFHWPLYRLLREPLKTLIPELIRVNNSMILDFGVSSIILALTIGVSLATWNLFEKRFIALKSILAPRK